MDDTGILNDERKQTFLLINCLNLNGASKDIINYRISCFKTMEAMYCIANLEKSPMRGYFIGSQIEGTALIGSESDEDIMFVNEDITVICETDRHKVDQLGERLNRMHSTQVKSNFPIGVITESEETPGYVQIRVVDAKTYHPLTECDTNPISHLCYTDSKGFLLLSTEKLKTKIGIVTSERYSNGPAMTETSNKEFHSSDLVYGLYTKAWPKSADEWLSRKRRYLWPPTNVTKLVDDGCFLVPTGSSYESETIWRLSFVQIEKEMVWTWSAMQYKCFMLLKLIKRNILQTVLPDVISSYQLKTILFWVSEETDPLFWKTNNIRECFTRCLKFLLECVQNENCPHYFVRTNNLFRGKLNKRLKEELISILSRILQNFWTEVFKIPSLCKVSENLEGGEIECFADVLTATLRHPAL
ncbi:cyclic GMP-AMP synthase-like receptor 2 isoform X1 [Mytilus edulis]|uniref:cyclic GMP-AMP synthase-like receptor 2 isoform X1 n=1 Tax=Mytilus edulis TaxID=6550 RepID=UPI0039EF71B7